MGTDYCSCQVPRKNRLFQGFSSDTGPKTQSADRDPTLVADFFILQDDLFRFLGTLRHPRQPAIRAGVSRPLIC
jgi:hypothetical protein